MAGVAAAARIVRDLAEAGAVRIVLAVPGGRIAESTRDDIRRLSPDVALEIVEMANVAAIRPPRPDARAILRATAKPSDGMVSRWLNRPVSRVLSALLLRIPGIQPIHAPIGSALLTTMMFAALALGGEAGLIAGGLLFHVASVFDGVDGEIARATFRTSRLGAVLDSLIDMATNALFIIGATLNLAARDPLALPVGAWGLFLLLAGLVAISRSASRDERPFSMDVVKRRYGARFSAAASGWAVRFLTIVSSRDFFALLFAVLIVAGVPMAVLYIFSAAASIWILFVIFALAVPALAGAAEGSA